MPKPQGIYLQKQKLSKIALRAQQGKRRLKEDAARKRRAHAQQLELKRARNVAYLAHEHGQRSAGSANKIRQDFAELLDELEDYHGRLEDVAKLHSEIREPLFEFRAVSTPRPVDPQILYVEVAMAAITLLMVLEKHFKVLDKAQNVGQNCVYSRR